MKKVSATRGFTVVELLIVIVVIAILAAITLVAYNSIQQRAKNVAIISAASQSMSLIRGYITLNGKYPLYGQSACITDESGCAESPGGGDVDGDEELTAAMSELGTFPRSVPISGNDRYGVMYSEKSTRSYDGNQDETAVIYYYLNGTNQDCGMSRVANDWDDEYGPVVPIQKDPDSDGGNYTLGDLGGKTYCIISIPRG